jgi:hypothetical protein
MIDPQIGEWPVIAINESTIPSLQFRDEKELSRIFAGILSELERIMKNIDE